MCSIGMDGYVPVDVACNAGLCYACVQAQLTVVPNAAKSQIGRWRAMDAGVDSSDDQVSLTAAPAACV